MSIKNRTIISLLLSFFLILGIIIFATNMVINSSFEDLETNTILSKLRSLRSGLEQEQKELEKTVRDWAHWDDMRDYVNHYNPSFIQSNISESLFQNYNLNHVAIIDTDFRVVYAAAYDQYDEVYQDLSGIGFNYLEQMVPDLKSMQPADCLSFTLKTSSGPLMLVFMPILDSSAQGPVNGYFMMGRILKDYYIQGIRGLSGVRITATDLTQDYNDTIQQKINDTVTGNRVKLLDNIWISASDLLYDVNGDKLFLIEIDAPMEATEIARDMRNVFLIIFICLGLFVGVLLNYILGKYVLNRLVDVQKNVKHVTDDPTSDITLAVKGDDELSDLANNINRMLGSLRDSRVELEAAKQRAEESDRLKSSFLNSITHELRTPLNHIMGFSQLISSQIRDGELKDFARQIYISGESLLRIIQDIIDLALAEHSMLKAKPHPIQGYDHFFRNKTLLEEILKASGNEHAVKLIFNADQSCLMKELLLDSGKVNQILHKLFLNAVKYTAKGQIEFGMQAIDAENLRYYVKDSGIGIEEEKQKLIFNYFRQSDEGSNRKYNGVGIGLSIAKRIAEIIGATLYVESVYKQGSCFYLDVPCISRKLVVDKGTGSPTDVLLSLPEASFLVVDSDATAMVIMKSLITSIHASCHVSSGIKSALEIARVNTGINCAIIAVELCKGKEIQLIKSLREIIPELPVVFTSGSMAFPDAIHKIANVYVIRKPFVRDEFHDILRACVARA